MLTSVGKQRPVDVDRFDELRQFRLRRVAVRRTRVVVLAQAVPQFGQVRGAVDGVRSHVGVVLLQTTSRQQTRECLQGKEPRGL